MITPSSAFGNLVLACKTHGIAPTRFVLVVSVADQTVSLVEKVCSPAFRRSGPAESGTPNGYRFVRTIPLLHLAFRHQPGRRLEWHAARAASHRGKDRRRLAGRDGFQGRQPIGYTWKGLPFAKITTRILWLEGLEPGINRGGNVDSHRRYIYLHGTGDDEKVVTLMNPISISPTLLKFQIVKFPAVGIEL